MGSPAASADIGALGAPPLFFHPVRLTQETAMADTSSSAGKPIAVPVSIQLTGAEADDKLDSLTGEPIPVLEDKNNHLIDALRYALEGARRIRAKPATVAISIPSMARLL
jgi:hypothetical protein